VLAILEEVHAAEAKSFSSATIDTLNTSRNSPSSQLKEACALAVRAMSSCSPSMANKFINGNILGNLVSICADGSEFCSFGSMDFHGVTTVIFK
jgi:hypothetical protein